MNCHIITLVRAQLLAGILFILMLSSGCANIMTNTEQYRSVQKQLGNRDVSSVIKKIESRKAKIYKRKDKVLEYLDLGILYHYQGDYAKSNQLLEQAERLIEDKYSTSVSKAAMSLLLNDNALDYTGEDFEDVYINVFKALNFLHLSNFDASFVEIRRIDNKLAFLEDKHLKMAKKYNSSKDSKSEFVPGTNRFLNSALARYLSMIIYKQEGRDDDVRIDLDKIQQAFELQPSIYDFDLPPLYDPLKQLTDPTLHVLAMVGTSPYKRAREFHIATAKSHLTIVAVDKSIDAISLYWPGIDPDYYFKLSLPYIVNDPSIVNMVVVRINGEPYKLNKLEDIGKVAEHTFKVKEPLILLKSITRSVVKGMVAEAAKDQAKKKNKGITGDLLSLAADIAIFATENADLRSSRFLPNAVLVRDIHLTEGEYSVAIEYYDAKGNILYIDDKGLLNISGNSLNLLESWQLQ